ncbi:hypothetical protein ACLOJK_033069 [Asimina triloba]
MLETELQFAPSGDEFCGVMKSDWCYRSHHRKVPKGKAVIANNRSAEGGWQPDEQPSTVAEASSGNLERFLKSTTPSVPSKHPSKTTMWGLRKCDAAYFTLGDLWESFKEWSAYGAAVPLVLNGGDCVVQYYVPYLSGIQLYTESAGMNGDSSLDLVRQNKDVLHPSSQQEGQFGDESDGDCYMDSSSDGISDSDLKGDFKSLREQFNCHHLEAEEVLDPYTFYHFSESNCRALGGKPNNYEFEICTIKIVYRYNTSNVPAPTVTGYDGIADSPVISLPVLGLASYKFGGSTWTPGGCEKLAADTLLQSAGNWLRHLNVSHPDFRFFTSHSPRSCLFEMLGLWKGKVIGIAKLESGSKFHLSCEMVLGLKPAVGEIHPRHHASRPCMMTDDREQFIAHVRAVHAIRDPLSFLDACLRGASFRRSIELKATRRNSFGDKFTAIKT